MVNKAITNKLHDIKLNNPTCNGVTCGINGHHIILGDERIVLTAAEMYYHHQQNDHTQTLFNNFYHLLDRYLLQT